MNQIIGNYLHFTFFFTHCESKEYSSPLKYFFGMITKLSLFGYNKINVPVTISKLERAQVDADVVLCPTVFTFSSLKVNSKG